MKSNPPFRTGTGSEGFTLFEVLLALGIFGLMVVGMMGALNSALSSAREVRMDQLIRSRLENRLASLEGGDIKELKRTVEEESPKIKFVETVVKEPVRDPQNSILEGFWRVKIVAEWSVGGETKQEEVSILRYTPR